TKILYTGQQFDPVLLQYYLRARFYASAVGRFTQMDGKPGRIENPQTLNRFAYVKSDPINFIDPSGHEFWSALRTLIVQTVRAFLYTLVFRALGGAFVGAIFGGIASGILHLLQNGPNGLWEAVQDGALWGAIYGAIIGASSVHPVLLALTLNVIFGINVYISVPLLLDPQIKPQTKVAIVFFLILGAR